MYIILLKAISEKNKTVNYENLSADEVGLRRDGWLTIIRNLINEKKSAACSS